MSSSDRPKSGYIKTDREERKTSPQSEEKKAFEKKLSGLQRKINLHADNLNELPRTVSQGREAERVARLLNEFIQELKTISESTIKPSEINANKISAIKEFQEQVLVPTIKGKHPPKKKIYTSGSAVSTAGGLVGAFLGANATVGAGSSRPLPPQVSAGLKEYCEELNRLCEKEKTRLSIANEADWVVALKAAIKQNFKLLDKHDLEMMKAKEFNPNSLAGTAKRMWDICNNPDLSNKERRELIQEELNKKIDGDLRKKDKTSYTTIENSKEPKYAFYVAARLALKEPKKADIAPSLKQSFDKIFASERDKTTETKRMSR
ncbi:MAG: hypothetical protein ACYCQI_03695 [Gammaproteobacteria bacterium]